MKITMEPTELLAIVDGVRCRIWRGRTDGGTDCTLFVAAVAVEASNRAACARFERELMEVPVVLEEPPP